MTAGVHLAVCEQNNSELGTDLMKFSGTVDKGQESVH